MNWGFDEFPTHFDYFFSDSQNLHILAGADSEILADVTKPRSRCVVPSGLISEFKDLLTNKEPLIRFDLLDDAELFNEVFSL